MGQFQIRIEASATFVSQAPALEVWVDDQLVSSALVTAQTGIGFDVLNFSCGYAGSCPASIFFRFSDRFLASGRSITMERVSINGRNAGAADIDSMKIVKNQESPVGIRAIARLFDVPESDVRAQQAALSSRAVARYLIYRDNLNYTTVSEDSGENMYHEVHRIVISDAPGDAAGATVTMSNVGNAGSVSIPHKDAAIYL